MLLSAILGLQMEVIDPFHSFSIEKKLQTRMGLVKNIAYTQRAPGGVTSALSRRFAVSAGAVLKAQGRGVVPALKAPLMREHPNPLTDGRKKKNVRAHN